MEAGRVCGRKRDRRMTTMSKFAEGSVCLVTGYTGVVGSGVVLHLLAETKTTVIAVVREGSAPSNLGENHPRLIVVPGIAADGSMDTLQQAIRDAIGDRQIDHVVSIFGGKAPRKPLTAFDDADVMASAERSLPHLRLLKSVPMPTTSYTFVSGMLGERCFMPDKLTGMTLSNAILYGMIVAFRAELAADGKDVRVLELRIGSMLHKPEEEEAGENVRGHPTLPPSSAASMKSFSSVLIGRYLVDAVERRNEDVIRLQDTDLQ